LTGISLPTYSQRLESRGLDRTEFLDPTAPPGVVGEKAKLRRRGGGRQPAVAEAAASSVAKSNNFGFADARTGSAQA
jgi:hypothetical protein